LELFPFISLSFNFNLIAVDVLPGFYFVHKPLQEHCFVVQPAIDSTSATGKEMHRLARSTCSKYI